MADIDDGKAFVRTCIKEIFCEIQERLCLGKDITKPVETLKKLYLHNNLETWNDIGDDLTLDDLYCNLPECLNR